MQSVNKTIVVIVILLVVAPIVGACQILIEPIDSSSGMGGGPVASSVQMQTTFAQFNAQGELIRPDPSYREKFVYIGTPLTPNDLNDGRAPFPEFHNVYMDPVTFQHFKETGEIRDGAMVLKELISVGDKKASSGNGYFMGEFIGLEAAVKSTEHFANEPQ